MKKLTLKSLIHEWDEGDVDSEFPKPQHSNYTSPEHGKTMYVVQIKQLPTFYLDADVLGITNSSHAKRIVQRMIQDMKNLDVNDIKEPEKVDM